MTKIKKNLNEIQEAEPDYEERVLCDPKWSLKDAANLFLGFDPEKGGTFYQFEDLITSNNSGLILTDSETIHSVKILKLQKPKVVFKDSSDLQNKIRSEKITMEKLSDDLLPEGVVLLEGFVKDHPDLDYDDDLNFDPIKIIIFFQKHFLNTPPQSLLSALGLKKRTVKDQSMCRKWLISTFKDDPQKTGNENKTTLTNKAIKKFNIAPNWFARTLWPDVTKDFPAWTKPGPPKMDRKK